MRDSAVRLEYLADCGSHLPQLAQWHHAEFGYLNPANTAERYLERLAASLQKSGLPTTLIALLDDTLLGSASLVRQTITHQHLSPWLSSVYVDPQHRGRGIASALVGRVEQAAAAMGSEKIYLFTPQQRKALREFGMGVDGIFEVQRNENCHHVQGAGGVGGGFPFPTCVAGGFAEIDREQRLMIDTPGAGASRGLDNFGRAQKGHAANCSRPSQAALNRSKPG